MKLNKAREQLLDMYIQSLKEEKLMWHKTWDIDYRLYQHNPVTNTTYRGVNSLLLNMIASMREYADPRWATFNQIKDNGWKLEDAKGQGVPVEFWSVYDKEAKKTVTLAEYNEAIRLDPDCKERFNIVDKTYFVFNAKHIKGIPPLEKDEQPHKLKNPSKFIENLIQNMGVGYEEHGNEALYNPRLDKVVVPDSTQFHSQYEYDATRLHELCHATGHASRLDRKIANKFGTQEYAKEELRAELTASLLAQDISVQPSQIQLDNHKAYIQAWIQNLQDDPNELFRAIKEAEKIYDYVVEKGELEKFMEIEKDDLMEEKKHTKSPEYLEESEVIYKKASTLPDGWKWVHYADASGHLESPDGKGYFSYDWSTGDYKITENSSYDIFLDDNDGTEYSIGSFDEFKNYAEEWIKENVIAKEQEVNSIESNGKMNIKEMKKQAEERLQQKTTTQKVTPHIEKKVIDR